MLGPSDPVPDEHGDLILQRELAYRLPFSRAQRRVAIFQRKPEAPRRGGAIGRVRCDCRDRAIRSARPTAPRFDVTVHALRAGLSRRLRRFDVTSTRFGLGALPADACLRGDRRASVSTADCAPPRRDRPCASGAGLLPPTARRLDVTVQALRGRGSSRRVRAATM